MIANSPEDKARKRLRALLSEIARHDRLYYQENMPEISDFEYDCLQAEVKALYQQFPHWEQVVGPGSDLKPGALKEMEHLSPMLSLGNTYSKEELFDFDTHLCQALGGEKPEYVLEPKVDGMAVNLIYEQGRVVHALTRGNGRIGEDVLENIRTIAAIPMELPTFPFTLEVRGEVYISKKDFIQINEAQEQAGLEPFSNARNLAAGSIKLLNVDEVRRRRLSFVAHGIGVCGKPLETQVDCRRLLETLHFPGFPAIHCVKGIEAVWAFIEQFQQSSVDFPYVTDGVVVKLNNREQQQQLGATAKAPRWAIAYKFEPESAETTLKSVTFQVGRTGVITPVAELEPVTLSGSTIARATLHNFNEIKKKDIRIGDKVILQKAGEVIPAIVGVNLQKRPPQSQEIICPQTCPACGAPLIHLEGEVAVRCPSLQCPEQLRLKLVHFVAKESMDIVGLGPKVIDVLLQQGWVHTVADLFILWRVRSEWIQLDGFGTAIVDQILNALEAAKHCDLWHLIYALSIPHVGQESAKNLAQHFKTLDALQQASFETLEAIPLVGSQTADVIVQFFNNEDNRQILTDLKRYGVQCVASEESTTLPWFARTFVLTGSLQQWTRSQAKQAIERLGGRVTRVVSAQTFALIAGEKTGTKKVQAQALNVPIWDEVQFQEELQHAEQNHRG